MEYNSWPGSIDHVTEMSTFMYNLKLMVPVTHNLTTSLLGHALFNF